MMAYRPYTLSSSSGINESDRERLMNAYTRRALEALDAYRFYIDAADFELQEAGLTRENALARARELDPYDGVTPSEIAATES